MDVAGGQPAARLYHFAMGQRSSKLHDCMFVVGGQHPSNDYVNICCYEYFVSNNQILYGGSMLIIVL